MSLRGTAVALVVVSALVLAGCTQPEPTFSPSAAVSLDATPGEFTLDEVRAVLDELPAEAPFAWQGGVATTSPGNPQFTWADYASDPLQCAPLYHLQLLAFEDDREVAPADVIVSKALADTAGAGPEDDRFLAYISVRILDEPERAMRDGVYVVKAAADACQDGYRMTYAFDGTEASSVTGLDELPNPDTASEVDGMVVLSQTSDGAFAAPESLQAWVAVDNLLVTVTYDIDPDIPEASRDKGLALVAALPTLFGEASGS